MLSRLIYTFMFLAFVVCMILNSPLGAMAETFKKCEEGCADNQLCHGGYCVDTRPGQKISGFTGAGSD
uniref:Uncharacterized protein n=1 Tax=Panagrolaimus sp. PS1159 TaxID=55785 RepID=A0AC35GI55_9BILA